MADNKERLVAFFFFTQERIFPQQPKELKMIHYIELALSFHATVYGFSEMKCGSTQSPQPCDESATTASGHPFDPNIPSAAIPMPQNRIMRPFYVCLQNPKTGKKIRLLVNDKTNAKWIGKRGFDLSPAAFRQLTGKDAKAHSQIPKLVRCYSNSSSKNSE